MSSTVDLNPEHDAARLRELHGRLIATAEVVEKHFAEAIEVKRQLDDLVAARGVAAERAARATSPKGPSPRGPRGETRWFEHRRVEVRDVGVE